MNKFFEDKRPHNGKTFPKYMNEFQEVVRKSVEIPDIDSSYLKLNLQRSQRILKSYKPSTAISERISSINKPQIWMVLTENWCGDSAQTLPYISLMADSNPLIDLRILERDSNLDIMDYYLTGGTSRSIPKLVAFDNSGNELFTWGPRPAEAQKLVDSLKEKGFEKEEFIKELHKWYAMNKGAAIESEFLNIL